MDQNVSFSAGIKATRTKYGLGLPYTAYIIQVRVEQDQNFTSWNVARRFNAFFSLNQKLEKRHAGLRGYPFPRKNRMTRYDHDVIEMRCRELGNYLTKCLDIPAVSDDSDFRTFLGFPSNIMHLKARAFSVMPEAIDHGEAGDGEDDVDGSSDEENHSHHDSSSSSSKPPTLMAPPEESSSPTSKRNGPPPLLPPKDNSSSPNVNSTSNGGDSGSSSSTNPAFIGLVPPTDEDGIAMFDYGGAESSELAFSVGEVVHMIESNAPADWAAGFTDRSTADKPGYFPRSFVRPFTSEDYIYNSTTSTWSLRDDIANFTYDPAKMTYHYGNPPRAPAHSLYK